MCMLANVNIAMLQETVCFKLFALSYRQNPEKDHLNRLFLRPCHKNYMYNFSNNFADRKTERTVT